MYPSSALTNTLWHQNALTDSSSALVWCNYQNKTISNMVANQSSKQGKPLVPPIHFSSNTASSFQCNLTEFTKTTKQTNKESALTSLVSTLSPLFPIPNILVDSFFTTIKANLTNQPLHPSVDPKLVLSGNFAPVHETPATVCSIIEGEIPLSLNGAYIRNGPNPQHQPHGPHHLFEGDGMLHSIRISQGQATFCSRYIKTCKFNLESNAGFPIIPNILSGFYCLADLGRCMNSLGRAMIGQIRLNQGFGAANTSVLHFCNRLFATVEIDLPYEIKITQEGDIETIGRYNLGIQNMTAHPKVETETGEVFAFRCFPVYPYLTFFRFQGSDASASIQQIVPIYSLTTPSYIHDFAITKNYAVFPDTQLEMDVTNLILCKGCPATYRPGKTPRVGIIPRNAKSDSEMRWFDVPGFNAFHVMNAWEDDHDGVVIVAPNTLHTEDFFQAREKLHFSLQKLRIDMKTGDITTTTLSERSLELGSINPEFAGKENRYVYMAVSECVPKMSGVVKIDLKLGCEVARRRYDEGWFGGEVMFVAREESCEEDDGFLVSYVHNEMGNESRFVVMDAKSCTLEVVAAVRLPGRVPYGFHGLFVREEQLEKL